MFSRSPQLEAKASPPDGKSPNAFQSVSASNAGQAPPPAARASPAHQPAATAAGFTLGSIIGNDLVIVGQGLRIITKGTLQVDGKVEGDVVGREVIIGDRGEVTGVVSGDSVVVRGKVSGTIRSQRVTLHSSARVEGDAHHNDLTIEEGAHLEGRVRRSKDAAELTPDFSPTPPDTARSMR